MTKENQTSNRVLSLAHLARVAGVAIDLGASGHPPLRLLTDVSGEFFWTLVVEVSVETVDEFFTIEQSLMGDESVRNAMAGYHELVERGRREIYRVEN